jgi:hypothetical protein
VKTSNLTKRRLSVTVEFMLFLFAGLLLSNDRCIFAYVLVVAEQWSFLFKSWATQNFITTKTCWSNND